MTELVMYGDRDCHAEYKTVIERTLSKYLQRTIKTVEDQFNPTVKRWTYRIYIDIDGYLEPVKCSATCGDLLRRLVTHAYNGSRQAREYLLNPWGSTDMYNGGFALIELPTIKNGGMISHTFWPGVIPEYSQREVAYYWIIRGWAQTAAVRDDTVSPPKFNEDGTITLFVRRLVDIHDFMLSIKGYLNDGIKVDVEVREFESVEWDEEVLSFRAMSGYPLIIGYYGIRERSDSNNNRDIKSEYLNWLYPCIDNDDLSWGEFGRIIKVNDQCHALGQTPDTDENITFMRIARSLALAGVYPLGPFPGLMLWPKSPPNVDRDRKLLGLPSITQLLLE